MDTCNHPTDERYFTDDNLLEWCGLCGQVVTDHHERKYGEPHPEHFPKRGRGRPRFDPAAPSVRTSVCLTQAQVAKAKALGNGNVAQGVRNALEQA